MRCVCTRTRLRSNRRTGPVRFRCGPCPCIFVVSAEHMHFNAHTLKSATTAAAVWKSLAMCTPKCARPRIASLGSNAIFTCEIYANQPANDRQMPNATPSNGGRRQPVRPAPNRSHVPNERDQHNTTNKKTNKPVLHACME